MKAYKVPGLDRQTTYVVVGTSVLLIVWSLGSSLLSAGPISASIITYLLYFFYWFYALRFQNPLLMRLMVIGTVAGILELVTDHFLVSTIDSLVYPKNEAMIWSSPLYMPFAWSNVLLQLSFIGMLLVKRVGLLKASFLLCLAGGMYIPLYEHLAKGAGWWWYKANTLMVFNAPVYVIVCEALISLSLPALVLYAEKAAIKRSVLLGVVEGVWILISAHIAYMVAH